MHEVPGISADVAHFARLVVDAGFTVFMPRLFGPVEVKTIIWWSTTASLRAKATFAFRMPALFATASATSSTLRTRYRRWGKRAAAGLSGSVVVPQNDGVSRNGVKLSLAPAWGRRQGPFSPAGFAAAARCDWCLCPGRCCSLPSSLRSL